MHMQGLVLLAYSETGALIGVCSCDGPRVTCPNACGGPARVAFALHVVYELTDPGRLYRYQNDVLPGARKFIDKPCRGNYSRNTGAPLQLETSKREVMI